MTKKRISIPRGISDAVLKEYRHKCAVCGRHDPQLHHLDENPSNNDILNLLPLCPNCHLQDVHDPTSQPDSRKLRLFRVYKDPLILDPRFHPIFQRMVFLRDAELEKTKPKLFNYLVNELLAFIVSFEKGNFYQKKMLNILRYPSAHYALKLAGGGSTITKEQIEKDAVLKQQARNHRIEKVEGLIIEMIRYQGWTPQPPHS